MTLAELMRFAVAFNIDPNKLGFHGEHNEIYIYIADEDMGFLPKFEDFEEWELEAQEAFCEKHGIFHLDDGWGFYSWINIS